MFNANSSSIQAETLRDINLSLQGLIDASPLPMIVYDQDAYIQVWNPAAERLFGWTADEVIGKVLPTIPMDKTEEFNRLWESSRRGESLNGVEVRRLKKDGTLIDVCIYALSLPNGEGVITHIMAIVSDITERKRAEKRSEEAWWAAAHAIDRTLSLQTIAHDLAEALTVQQVSEVVLAQSMRVLKASNGAVLSMTTDGTALDLIQAANYTDKELAAWRRIPLDAHVPITYAAKTGKPALSNVPAELSREYPPFSFVPSEVGYIGWAAIPLIAKGNILGVIALTFHEEYLFSADDVAFMMAVAQQCAQALERARLYDVERTTRSKAVAMQRRLEFIADASALLATSLDYKTTLNRLALQSVPIFADYCIIYVLENEHGVIPTMIGYQDEEKGNILRTLYRDYTPTLMGSSMTSRALRSGEPQFVATMTDAMFVSGSVDERELRLVRALGLVSTIIVPLLARGQMFGTMTFSMAASGRHYAEEDLEVAQELARRVAVAVDNSQLYKEAQQAIERKDESLRELQIAMEAAEAGSRAKSNFLTTMSHELRTPLHSVIGMSQVLLMQNIGPMNKMQQQSVEDILVSGKHLLALINDVLDLSKADTNRIQLHVSMEDMRDMLQEGISVMRQRATEQDIALSTDIEDNLPLVSVDRRRIVQVILNLLSNAVKFTPAGGRVKVRLSRRGADHDQLRVEVIDTGIGVSARNRPRLFQPFERLEDIPVARRYEGTGLGLALSKRLVELHNGDIGVESAGEGFGSTFWFSIPLDRSTG